MGMKDVRWPFEMSAKLNCGATEEDKPFVVVGEVLSRDGIDIELFAPEIPFVSDEIVIDFPLLIAPVFNFTRPLLAVDFDCEFNRSRAQLAESRID